MKNWIFRNFFVLSSNLLCICLLACTCQRNTQREKANEFQRQAHKWEQLYRDCQAARQFGEPAHAADAANDVTR